MMRLMRISLAPGGARPIHLAGKPPQAFDVVNVVPDRQHVDVESDFARALQRLRGDALGAPGDVIEQAAVRGFQAEQIIAAVARRTEHGALARPRQHRPRSPPGTPSAASGCRN